MEPKDSSPKEKKDGAKGLPKGSFEGFLVQPKIVTSLGIESALTLQ